MVDAIPLTLAPGSAPCSASAYAFTLAGAPQIGIAVKCVLEMQQDGPCRPLSPEPIGGRDTTAYKPRADVMFVDGVEIPAGARLFVSRVGRVLLDKRFAEPAVPRRRATAVEAGKVTDYARTFKWATLQLAPDDQTCDFLEGTEWIAFERIHPRLPRAQSFLPRVVGSARLFGQDGPKHTGPPGRAIPLRIDTVVISPADLRVELVLRGSAPLGATSGASATIALQLGDRVAETTPPPKVVTRKHETMDARDLTAPPASTPFKKTADARGRAPRSSGPSSRRPRVTAPPEAPGSSSPPRPRTPTLPFRAVPPGAPNPAAEVPSIARGAAPDPPVLAPGAGQTVTLTNMQQLLLAAAGGTAMRFDGPAPPAEAPPIERLTLEVPPPSAPASSEPAPTSRAPSTAPNPSRLEASATPFEVRAAPAAEGPPAPKKKLGRELLSLLARGT